MDEEDYLPIEIEQALTTIPPSIARDVEASHPNFEVIRTLDDRLVDCASKWVLLYGSPGCGKTTLSASYESADKNLMVLGRFFFKVTNDIVSRAERCSQGYFVDWLETVYANQTGADLVYSSYEDKRNKIPEWLFEIGHVLASEEKRGVIIIDGIDELATENGNRVDDILSLFPKDLPENISVVLSCITREILPSYIIERIDTDDYIKVTPLNMVSCESFIQENSGEWPKSYSFIQAVAIKTEGHPLYMNYLCRYISDSFNETTKEHELDDWLNSLPILGGDIRSYYEAVWKKADPKESVFEILALLSQIRGPILEAQLIGMMKIPNPFEFKSLTKEFRHLLKEKDSDVYEIYHSSFRAFITNKLSSIINYTNDQIAFYCKSHKSERYSIENYLHHVVAGNDVKKGLDMCNQEWADQCALNDVSPDLIMHDIKECLSLAVDNNMPIEVVRLMLLAQRIETRCDSIMVDNAREVADIKILMGMPEVALKYLVRDNSLLIGIDTAISYLRCLFELGYNDEAYKLSVAIDAAIRKQINENIGKKSSPYIFVLKGELIVEGILSGFEAPTHLPNYFGFLNRLIDGEDDESVRMKSMIRDMILAYQISNELRAGKKIDIEKHLRRFGVDWNEELLVFFIKVIALYDATDTGLHTIGHNDAFNDGLRQIEEAMERHSFTFTGDDLKILPNVLIDKCIRADLVQKILKDYGPNPGTFVFRDSNGVDINVDLLTNFFQECMYVAYLDESLAYPALNRNYYGDSRWENYIESLISRIAYVSGVLYRMRAAGENYQGVYSQVEEILDYIDFSFEIRIHWQRSYLLPEELIPFIYDKLAEVYRDFFDGKIDVFMDHLKRRMPDQLGMYREGYCAALIRLSGILVTKKNLKEKTLYLADEAVKYVEYAVQNRSERCNYLLQICRNYALLGEKEKMETVYYEVMNSSMGPEWYKEAQLEFINSFRKHDVAFDRKQISHLAAIFEEASGEMTFQRYVRQQKNEFVATIAKTSSLKDAIDYYKFETLPSVERIVRNAEDWKVDMPKVGDGYDLGCNHLIEASAVCQLLKELKEVSPFVRYAISELFWENWDKMHNDRQYATLHADILSSVEEQEALDLLVPKMADYYVNSYNKDGKGDYLKELVCTEAPTSILNELELKLKGLDLKWVRAVESSQESVGDDSHKERLSDLPSSQAILNKCRKDIVSPLGSYWYSLSEFIGPLIHKADFNIDELLEVIADHYDENVRPSKEQFEKFSWFVGKHEEDNVDRQMIHFLIWFLVHPERKVVMRAENSLMWLVKIDSRVIDCLFDEILNPSEIGLATSASSVLLEITKEMPEVVLHHMEDTVLHKKLEGIANFSVSRNLFEIARLFNDRCGYSAFLNDMKAILPDSLPDRGDVMLENKQMMFIEHKIDKLNDLKVTGGREFAKPYLEALKELGGEERMKLLMKADRYTARSYYMTVWQDGRYSRTMIGLLDSALYGKVDNKRSDHVYYAINS